MLNQNNAAYGVHVHPIRPGAREDRDEDRTIPNFYWAQEDYLKSQQRGQSWGWTVLRPSLVIGMAVGGAMNAIAAIGVYAAILKSRGEPLHFPGSESAMVTATDTGIIARCCEWALHSPKAANQCFNLGNGEFFSIKEEWPIIAQTLGMTVGEDRSISFARELPSMAAEWDGIRQKHNLLAPELETFLGQSTQFADFLFARTSKAPSSMSCIKVWQAGFLDMIYTDEMFKKWFQRYQIEKLLPPA